MDNSFMDVRGVVAFGMCVLMVVCGGGCDVGGGNGGNEVPLAQNQFVTTKEDAPVSIWLYATDADGDALTYCIVSTPTHGTLSGTAPNLTYTPNANYSGVDSFTFKVNDGKVNSNVATVNITIKPVNDPPTVTVSVSSIKGVAPLCVRFSAVGNDVDGDMLSYSWDFGDGTTSAEQNPTHTYTEMGRYRATVAVDDGESDTVRYGVWINVVPSLVEWERVYGRGGSDSAKCVQQTADGGYVLAGHTDSYGAAWCDMYLVKVDGDGNVEWEKTYGGNEYDGAEYVQQTADGGYVLAGCTDSYGAGEGDMYLVKVDGNGNVEWEKTYGDGDYDIERAECVQQTADGGYVIAGGICHAPPGMGKSYDMYVVKVDGRGNVEWEMVSDRGGDHYSRFVRQTADGGYIVVGATYSGGSWGKAKDILLVKLDCRGNVKWEKTYGSSESDTAWCVQQTSDGGYIVAGDSWGEGGRGGSMYLVKVDGRGNVEWEAKYGEKKEVVINSVQQTVDGGYIVAGMIWSCDAGDYNMYLVKVDGDGNVEWEKTYGGNEDEGAECVQRTADGGYIMAGWRAGWIGRDMYLVKVDGRGNVKWEAMYGGRNEAVLKSVQQTSDGGYIVAGRIWSCDAGDYNMYVVKVDGDGNVEWEKTYGGNEYGGAECVQRTADGGYIMAGVRRDDMYLVKVDGRGNVEWEAMYRVKNRAIAKSVQQTVDGGYIVAGESFEWGGGWYDMCLVKVDEMGRVEWEMTYGGSGSESAESVQQTVDGGYIVVGYTQCEGGGWYDMYVVKVDDNGNVEWEATYGGGFEAAAESVQKTEDGGYIIAGSIWAGCVYSDMYLVKVDEKGNVEWEMTYGGSGSEGAKSVQQTADGGYIVAGYTQCEGGEWYDMYVVKVDDNGNMEWELVYDCYDEAECVQQTEDGGYVVAGKKGKNGYVVKLKRK